MKKSEAAGSGRRRAGPSGRWFVAVLPALTLGSLILGGWGTEAAGQQPPPGAKAEETGQVPEDLRSPDALLKALYESLTFLEGGRPDLDRFAGLFASPASPCVRVTPGAVLATDLEGFLKNFGDRVCSGGIKSFREEEVSRRLTAYGNIIQAISVYRKTVNSSNPGDFVRGVNALQLFRIEGRWRIAGLIWQDETEGFPIPEKFLVP